MRPNSITIGVSAALLILAALGAGAETPPAAVKPAARFDAEVAPLLVRACLSCHGPANLQGGLDLSHPETARKGGSRGPALVPGQPEASWLWKRVAAGEMPPGKPLPAAQKSLLKRWIAEGGTWGAAPIDPLRYSSERRAGYDWWSLQPVRHPQPPPVKRKAWVANPVDAFVLARLEAAGLQPSPPASRATLIRRVTYDLTGLPPTPEEVDAFLADRSPTAWEKVVDRLLASPRYGERWARHWLDVVRFGESQGFERNKLRPNAWKYRDWVVEALNSDLPYDEFVQLQLAGDVLRPEDPLAVIASGFLVMGPYDLTAYTATSPMMMAAAREEELEGLVGTVGQTFLGLTANCARCHGHKFDPVAQKEYYRLAAALGGTYHGAERESLSPAGKAAAERERAALSRRIDHLKERRESLPAAQTAEREAVQEEQWRLESRVRLLSGGPAHVSVPKQPAPFHVLARGDWRRKGEQVAPGGIAALTGVSADWGLAPDAPEGEGRKALVAWITDPRNPLTARVMVNRLWAGHFGVGLVRTPNDFGFNGGQPSHPELLDYLASCFTASPADGEKESVRDGERERASPSAHSLTPSHAGTLKLKFGWSLKKLDRLILLSNTYRQASRPLPAAGKRDTENRLIWRQNPRRLEAEAFRDAVLRVSGDLDQRIGGPGYRDWTSKSNGDNELYTAFDAVGPEFNRRTLYRMSVRAGTSPFLDALDCPDPSVSTPRRSETTTPQQALSLLNNRFMEQAAGRWAERLERELPGDRRGQLSRAYRLAFGRAATEGELRFGEQFAARYGLSQFCLVLLNTNEFLYID